MTDRSYKASKYNFIKETERGELLLYNTKTGGIGLIENDQKDQALAIFQNPGTYIEDELFNQLRGNDFIIEAERDEVKEIITDYDNYLQIDKNIQIILLPAEACNFACPYCFNYRDRKLMMEDWVYDAILQNIEHKLQKVDTPNIKVFLTWFGGEPLLAADKIVTFTKKVRELCSKYSAELRASMVTNGYLLTAELFARLLDAGVTGYQVTLDGTAENHDKYRYLCNGGPTFDIIYNNLKSISENFKDESFYFNLRSNFMGDSLKYVEELMGMFVTDFNDDSRFNLYFRPVYQYETADKDISAIKDNICDFKEGKEIQNRLSFELMNKCGKENDMDLLNPLARPRDSWCGVEKKLVVGADGSIYICDTFVGDVEHRIGQIMPGGNLDLNETGKAWTRPFYEYTQRKKCLECKMLPICMGECRRNWLIDHVAECYYSEESIYSDMDNYLKYLRKGDQKVS